MSFEIAPEPLTAEAFAPFGDVLKADGLADMTINAGLCQRYHDRAQLDFGPDGRAGISVFDAVPRALPLTVDLMERHPLGSQAFLPLTSHPFLVIVASDKDGLPDSTRAFITAPHEGINFHRGTWHGVLTPLHAPGLFAVIDRIGLAPNLEEHSFPTPLRVLACAP
ncbi:MAG: ureidoglycolate lyase [Pseudomonadota bacterium]